MRQGKLMVESFLNELIVEENIRTKLIILEGIPGSGKTTMARRIHKYLNEHNISNKLYLEGEEYHPVDLLWCAYFNHRDYCKLLSNYNEQADTIKKNSIIEEEYSLVKYKTRDRTIFSDDLGDYLAKNEFCYSDSPIVPIDTFTEVFRKRFERFSSSIKNIDQITIFESTFFQHQIHDIHRNYSDDYELILNHLKILLDEIRSHDPVLFYITQKSVKESLDKTALIRSKSKWSSEESVNFWTWRKEIELQAINDLDMNAYIIDNSDYNWDTVFETIVSVLNC
ncbi:MAG: hypothetical protein KAQ68_04525 [Clostridiales bacterium]|nr:hypothetical protein [Clostridiales bacterium]